MALPQPTVSKLAIPGLYRVDLVANVLGEDARGSFREAWQNEKMRAAGLPGFQPVQYNVVESGRGALRGIHAEPWEKYIHLISGQAFAAFVELRPNTPRFGEVVTLTLTPEIGIFVTRGIGNSYLVTSPSATYSYLVNEHWQPGVAYPAVAYDDPELAIDWPLPVAARILSEKDQQNPSLKDFDD